MKKDSDKDDLQSQSGSGLVASVPSWEGSETPLFLEHAGLLI